MAYEIILFDLDGTLVDSRVGITKSIEYALQKLGIPSPSLKELEHFIGPPLKPNFMKTFNLTEAQADQAIAFYRERFNPIGVYENEVYPGVEPMLQLLHKTQKQLFIATTKPTEFAKVILEHRQLDVYFNGIVGSNLDGTGQHKHEVIAKVLTLCGRYSKSSVVMVGDRHHDIDGARRHGIASIGVTWGFGSREELVTAQADKVVDTTAELTSFLLG